jgi:putative serine protease PepD
VIGTDPISDLAVIKVDATDLTAATFGDSSKLNVGDTAIAIGAPLGLSGTVTDGIVSALNRSITIASSAVPDTSGDNSAPTPDQQSPYDFWNFDLGQGQGSTTQGQSSATISLAVIQTDAAINPGNSGGALLDSNGAVIGINVAIASSGSSTSGQSGSIGVGFAIPSNIADRVAKEIIATGTATHGLLGASVADVTDDQTQTASKVIGASIVELTSGGAAEAAGLKVGDVITNFNGIPITGKTDLTAQVRALPAGSKAAVTYVRGGQASSANVTLGTLQ